MNITEMAILYVSLQAQIDNLKSQQADIRKEFDRLRNNDMPDWMQEHGIKNVAVEGAGKVALYPVLNIKTLSSMSLHAWLQERGHGDLIKPTVNASTLKAWYKEQTETGEEVPGPDILEVDGFVQARITKS